MPSKGRQNPCSNVMKKGAREHKAHSEVRQCSPELLAKFRKYLPEFTWEEGVRLCGSCRAFAFRESKARKKAKRNEGASQEPGGNESASTGSSDSSSSSSSRSDKSSTESSNSDSESESENPPVSENRVENDIEPSYANPPAFNPNVPPSTPQPSTSSSSPQPGLYPVLQPTTPPSNLQPMGFYPPLSSTPDNVRIANFLSSPRQMTPASSIAAPLFATPTAHPPIRSRDRGALSSRSSVNLFPSLSFSVRSTASAGSHAVSPLTSPSMTFTTSVTSGEDGSVYHDEQSARVDLLQMLRSIGVPPPDRRPHGTRLSQLYNTCDTRVRTILHNYAGEDVAEPRDRCDCELCQLIISKVKTDLKLTTSKKERYMMLTTLPKQITVKKMEDMYGVTTYVARHASHLRNQSGPFSFPVWKSTGNPMPEESISIVQEFYCNNDNSRPSPNARDAIRVRHNDGSVTREPKRFMLANLKDTYNEFLNSHSSITIGISKFAELRPKNCRWPGHAGFHQNCTCIIHENINLMLEGLKNASADGISQLYENENPPPVSYKTMLKNVDELIEYVMCQRAKEECFLGYCETCPNEEKLEEVFNFSEGLEITFKTWQKNDIITQVLSHEEFSDKFKSDLRKFLIHQFIYKKQKEYIQEVKTGPLENGTSSVLTVDFGENYSFIVQNAVQGYHWNNRQATIHPFVFYTAGTVPGKPVYKTYFVISDEMAHDATTFHAFRDKVIWRIKEDFPNVTHIDYVSDGAGSQYKNFKNIGNLAFHKMDYDITARWIFTATSHGKSTCDAMSAVVKRTVRLESLKKDCEPITNPQKMYDVARAVLIKPTLEFLFVSKDEVQHFRDLLKDRYDNLEKIAGIRQNHHFEVVDDKFIIMKRLSSAEGSTQHCILKEVEMDQSENIPDEIPEIGDFFAIKVATSYQIGMVVQISSDLRSYTLRMMRKSGRGGVALAWPGDLKEQEVTMDDILRGVSAPVYSASTKNYRLLPEDYAQLQNIAV